MKLYPSLVARLSTQHETIPAIISPLDHTRLLLRPQPDKWHIKDNIAHLARYQMIFMDRVQQLLATEQPVFERYRAEEDPEFANWQDLALEQLIATLNADRKAIFHGINGMQDHELEQVGCHRKYGDLTMIQWTEFFLLHEAHHIFTIFQLAHDTML